MRKVSNSGKDKMERDGVSMVCPKAFEDVQVSFLKEDGSVEAVSDEIPFKIEISQEKTNTVISILNGEFAYCELLICSRQRMVRSRDKWPVPGQALFPDGTLINAKYLQEYITNISFVDTNIFLLLLPSPHIPAGDT